MDQNNRKIRLLNFSAADPFLGLALRQILLESVGNNKVPNTYAMVNYKNPFMSIGPLQDIDSVVDIKKCQENSVDIVRRTTASGGAIFYDGVINEMLVVKKKIFKNIDEVADYCKNIFSYVSKSFNYPKVEYSGNDMRWQEKKVGGFATISTKNAYMGLSFFNLRRPNMKLYLEISKFPKEKFSDKKIKDITQYVATPELLIGRPLTYAEVKKNFIEGITKILGVNIIPGKLTSEENTQLNKIKKKMQSDDFVFSYSSEKRFSDMPQGYFYGIGSYKAKKLIQINLLLSKNKNIIKDIMITGDCIISPASTCQKIEKQLINVDIRDKSKIISKIERVLDNPQVEQEKSVKVTVDDFYKAIIIAKSNAKIIVNQDQIDT